MKWSIYRLITTSRAILLYYYHTLCACTLVRSRKLKHAFKTRTDFPAFLFIGLWQGSSRSPHSSRHDPHSRTNNASHATGRKSCFRGVGCMLCTASLGIRDTKVERIPSPCCGIPEQVSSLLCGLPGWGRAWRKKRKAKKKR